MTQETPGVCKHCGSKLTATGTAAGAVVALDKPAGFWIRCFSELIDIIVVLVLVKMTGFTAPVGMNYILGADTASNGYVRTGIFILSLLAIFFIVVFYEIWVHVRFGQSLGKMAAGIKVVTIDNCPVTYKLSFLRCVGKFVNILTFGLGFILVAVHKQKRGLHDLIGNTKVCYVWKNQ
jgi:uncharacterized RDD family membrane protein YckC